MRDPALGHESLANTEIYTRVSPDRLRAAVDKLPEGGVDERQMLPAGMIPGGGWRLRFVDDCAHRGEHLVVCWALFHQRGEPHYLNAEAVPFIIEDGDGTALHPLDSSWELVPPEAPGE